MKKGTIGLEQIVFAIVSLLVVAGAVKITVDLTGKPVQYLLGFGNISAFDQDIIERYNQTLSMNADAISSINALLYSINRLAVFNDEHGFGTRGGSYDSFRKKIGGVTAEPTIFGERPKTFTGDKERVKLDLAEAIVECYAIFKDEAKENTRCFKADFDYIATGITIDKKDVIEGLKEYKDDVSCGSRCERYVNDLVGRGLFNSKNINFQRDLVVIRGKKNVRVCGDKRGRDEIHITTSLDDCKIEENYQELGFTVENFALPQEMSRSENPLVYVPEDWLNAYGDPQYILFYEKFPKYEEKHWEASAYDVGLAAILVTEGAFIGLNAVTLGFGWVLKRPVVLAMRTGIANTAVGKMFSAIKNTVVGLGRGTKNAVGGMLKKIFVNRWSKGAVRFAIGKQATKEGIEEIAEMEMKRIAKKAGAELSESELYILKKKYVEAFRELGDDIFTSTGRLKQEATGELKENFGRVMRGTWQDSAEDRMIMNSLTSRLGNNYDEVIEKVAKELSERAGKMGYRTLSSAAIKSYEFAYRAAERGRNTIKVALTGDMTDEARERAILKLIENGQEGLSKMKPRELRTFMANNQKAVDMIFDKHSGQILFGEVIDAGGDKAAQEAAKRVLTERLDNIIMKYGAENFGSQFPMSIAIQRNFAPIPSKLAKPKHLIAASAAYLAVKLESKAAKHYPVGTNAIGLKTPYMQTVIYDNVTHYLSEEEFLGNYGKDALHVGLLPVVNKYYLSLVRDKNNNWWDQSPERFFLVSPCYSDISLKVTNCECKGHEDEDAGLYWTGEEYELEDGRIINVPHFDGENPMIYKLDENGNPIKECYASSFWRSDTRTSVRCMQINPVLDEDIESNYCYHGMNPLYGAFKTGVTILEMGLPLLGAFCGPAAPACIIGLGFVTGVAGETLKGATGIGHQWPNHD